MIDPEPAHGTGREMTDREFRLTRELLDAHAQRLNDLAGRLDRLEPRVDVVEAAVAAQVAKARTWARFNRACTEPEHVSEAGPRR